MTTEPEALAAAYLIRKGGYYYRPNAQGYTIVKAEAGRYTLHEAISYTHPNGPDGPRDGLSYEPDDEPATIGSHAGNGRTFDPLAGERPVGLQEALDTIMARMEALENEAYDALATELSVQTAGFMRGQKSTAKSLRSHLHDMTRQSLPSPAARMLAGEGVAVDDVMIGNFIAQYDEGAAGCMMDADDAQALAREFKRMQGLIYCPGVLRCAKCEFRIIKTKLTPAGAFANEEPDTCPNCNVPMWRVTWKDEAHDAYKTAESQMDRALEAEAALAHPPAAEPVGLREAESNGLSGFDPARLREIPVWMVRDMRPGWQDQGAAAYHGADAIDRLESALSTALEALRKVGSDYPGSSCEQWCNQKSADAEAIAKGEGK